MALTQREFDELELRLDDPDTSDDEKREIATLILAQARDVSTRPEIAQAARERPVDAPPGRREELLGQAQPAPAPFPQFPKPTAPRTGQEQAEVDLQKRSVNEGIEQRATAIVDFLRRPFTDDEAQDALAQDRRDQNADATFTLLEDAAALGIDNADIFRDIGTGEFVPDVVLSILPAIAGRTVVQRIAGEALAGGTLFGSLVEGDESAVLFTTLGAVGSGFLGLLTEIPGIAKTVVAGDVAKALRQKFGNLQNVPRNPFLPTEAAQTTGLKQTVGETTGNSRVLALEAEAQARAKVAGPAEKFVQERSVVAIEKFGTVAKALNPEDISTPTIIKTLDRTRKEATRAINREASEAFRQVLAPGLKGVGARFGPRGQIIGGRRFIETGTLRAELKKIASDARKPVSGQPDRAKWADEQIRRLEQTADRRITIGDYQAITRDLADGAIAESALVKSKALQQALRSDLELTKALTTDIEIDRVIGLLEQANATFAAKMAPADEINAIFVQKLGLEEKGLSGEEFARRFDKLPPTQKAKVFNTIHKFDENLSRQLSGRVFQETMERNTVLSTTVEFLDQPLEILKIDSFAKDIAESSATNIRILLNTPGMDAQQTKLITAAFDQLNKLRGTPNAAAKGAASAVGRARELLINAVSRDAGFVSRLAAGEMTPGALERWLYTEKGLNALLDIGRMSLKLGRGGTQAAAIVGIESLLDLSNEADGVREVLERRIRLQRSLARLTQAGP